MSETNSVKIIIGVDTHKDVHAAVAINGIGARLGTLTIPVRPQGYRNLETWARAFGAIHAFGIEGTGSYGAGLSRFLQAKGHTVVEVNRPNRQLRHQNGKSDPLDAESAARAVLGGQANARPKSADSAVEMIRHLKVARDTAVKSRTQAMVTLKTIIINAPAALRQALDRIIGKMTLIRHLAALRPGPILSVTASAKAALRAIARRWLTLDAEIRAHDADLEALTASCAPAMLEAHGPRVPQLRCSSSSATIPNASAPRPLSPNSVAPVRFQPRAGKRTDIASTAEATGRPMLPCIES